MTGRFWSTLIFSGAAFVFMSAAAQAQAPSKAQQDAIRSNCRSDFMKNCSSVTPGGREALECLMQNKAKVSGGCQGALNAVSAPAPRAKPEPKPEPKAETKAEPAAAPPAGTGNRSPALPGGSEGATARRRPSARAQGRYGPRAPRPAAAREPLQRPPPAADDAAPARPPPDEARRSHS